MDVTGLVICLNNDDYTSSLELYKVYPVVKPYANDPDGYIRIVDESGEDYIYPSAWFETVNLGAALESRIVQSVPAI
jgi:hypothetical protein